MMNKLFYRKYFKFWSHIAIMKLRFCYVHQGLKGINRNSQICKNTNLVRFNNNFLYDLIFPNKVQYYLIT